MSAQPYISFVTYGRNDGYTADYVRRVGRAVRCLAHQLERAELASEIIISEWNPPKDRPLLIEALDIPAGLRHVTIAGVITGAEHHKHFIGADEVGIHVTEAANVGLRRARGEFIVGKSSDTFYSPEVIAKIAARNLRQDTIYRVDRHDVFIDDPALWDLPDDAMLEKFSTMPGNIHGWIQQSPEWGLRDLHTNACGDFTLMAAHYWKALRGYPRDPTVLALDSDSLVLHAAAALGATECRWPESCRVYKPAHSNMSAARVQQLWSPWQQRLDRYLQKRGNIRTAHWLRRKFDYPKRKVRRVGSVTAASIERNFVVPARQWNEGVPYRPSQEENWGLGDQRLETARALPRRVGRRRASRVSARRCGSRLRTARSGCRSARTGTAPAAAR